MCERRYGRVEPCSVACYVTGWRLTASIGTKGRMHFGVRSESRALRQTPASPKSVELASATSEFADY
jgi:hypothetical protein